MGKEKAVIRSDMSKFKWTLNEMKKNKAGYFMALPFFILFFVFTVVPVVLSFILGFTTFNLLEWPTFVFMDNYIRLIRDLPYCPRCRAESSPYSCPCCLSPFLLTHLCMPAYHCSMCYTLQ